LKKQETHDDSNGVVPNIPPFEDLTMGVHEELYDLHNAADGHDFDCGLQLFSSPGRQQTQHQETGAECYEVNKPMLHGDCVFGVWTIALTRVQRNLRRHWQ
jgi:hypothetical protein